MAAEEKQEKKKNMMNACYKCTHRGTVPGDAHSSCNHPGRGDVTVKGDARGIKNGWFVWPYNFDPVWLKTCNGFEKKEK